MSDHAWRLGAFVATSKAKQRGHEMTRGDRGAGMTLVKLKMRSRQSNMLASRRGSVAPTETQQSKPFPGANMNIGTLQDTPQGGCTPPGSVGG